MAVIKPHENLGILFLPVLLGTGRKAAVIAVVRADYLNLIDADMIVRLRNRAPRRQSDHRKHCKGEDMNFPEGQKNGHERNPFTPDLKKYSVRETHSCRGIAARQG